MIRAYRFFHEHGCSRVGYHGVDALALAKAERWAQETEGVECIVEPEVDRYRDVYGDDPPKGVEFYSLAVKVDGEYLASLGFVDDTEGYHRVVMAQLADEAWAIVREREERAAAIRRVVYEGVKT
jgi:hypothetical protein